MEKTNITYKEVEIRKGKEVVTKHLFYKGNILVATILNNVEIYHDSLTAEEKEEIKKIASL